MLCVLLDGLIFLTAKMYYYCRKRREGGIEGVGRKRIHGELELS